MSVDTDKVYSPIFGTNVADSLSGTNRSEVFSDHRGNDTVQARSGSDLVYGGGGDDLLYGNSGNDILYGEAGADTLRGGKGDDVIHDGSGNDYVRGDSGDDLLIAGSGYDEYVGGSGFDTIDLSHASHYVKVDLHKHTIDGLGPDTVWGVEAAIGTEFSDTFKGGKRDNEFTGGEGDDWFRGLAGDNIFTGVEGKHTFFWRFKDLVSSVGTPIGLDEILDFGDGDILDLSELLGEPDESDLQMRPISLAKVTLDACQTLPTYVHPVGREI